MKPLLRSFAAALVLAAGAPVLNAASRVLADLQPAPKRQATVDLAAGLARRPAPEPLPTDLVSPFNPPGFDRAEPAPSARPSAAPATPAGAVSGPAAPAAGAAAVPSAPVAPTAPVTPRETLEAIAAQITPSGTMVFRGKPRLLIAGKPFEVGTRFTASFNNEDYELELVAIERTTFTLRYRGEDVTRPIKPAR
ncbi:MAG: hypothetical protein ACKODK_05385 [Opitutaceae bacterium]